MLPAKNRLPREEFRARGWRTVTTPFFSLKTKQNDVGVNRFAVVVGKSVDKRATQRNFWERQAKTQLLKAPKSSKDFIVIIFPRVASLSKLQFEQEMKKVLNFSTR
jgi:ribonuclease P protein component